LTTYREVKGYSVKSVTSDPSNIKEGQIWYNSSTKAIKVAPKISAWSSGGNLNNKANYRYAGGTQTAAFGAGGYNPDLSHLAITDKTEEYDGSSWTNTNDMGTARYSGCGCGTQTAGLATGGRTGPSASLLNEEYNGSTWTEAGDINTGHGYGYNVGIQTAALMATGMSNPSPATHTANAESYDGTSWTEGPNVNTARRQITGFGTSTAMVIAAGGPPNVSNVEEYNGTSWSEVTNTPTTRNESGASGILTDGLIFGGINPPVSPAVLSNTFSYDGTNWASAPALGTAGAYGNKGESESDSTSAIFFGTGPGGPLVNTQEYNDVATTRSVDVS
jgi:hypothetical protein